MKSKLSSDFERRLYRLEANIRLYKETGLFSDLFPSIFSVASSCWCKKPIVKSKL